MCRFVNGYPTMRYIRNLAYTQSMIAYTILYFDWIFLEIPVKNCIAGMLLTCPIQCYHQYLWNNKAYLTLVCMYVENWICAVSCLIELAPKVCIAPLLKSDKCIFCRNIKAVLALLWSYYISQSSEPINPVGDCESGREPAPPQIPEVKWTRSLHFRIKVGISSNCWCWWNATDIHTHIHAQTYTYPLTCDFWFLIIIIFLQTLSLAVHMKTSCDSNMAGHYCRS